MHAIKVAFQNVREQLTPVLQESAFLEKGVLTVRNKKKSTNETQTSTSFFNRYLLRIYVYFIFI